MGLLGKLVSAVSGPKPAALENPVIGFLNLLGPRGDVVVAEDRARLAPLFAKSKVSSGIVPHCQVLFIYADIDVAGHFANSPFNLADIVNKGAAHIVVVATRNEGECITQAAKAPRTRAVNIVLTLDRGSGVFAPYFVNLFSRMFEGESMPAAWAALSPHRSHAPSQAPSTMLIADGGQISFVRPGMG